MQKVTVMSTDIYRYNTKFIVQGDELVIKRYSEYSLKGYKVKDKKKSEPLRKRFNRHFKESDHKKVLPFDKNDLPRLSWWDIMKLEEKQKENFKKSVRRANKKIYELVACNTDTWNLKGNTEQVKFITLTFDNLIYPMDRQRKIIQGPPEFIKMSDIKRANKELTKFIKRLSYYHTGQNTNDLKYIAIPELQKRGAWHFHIIFFNLPYTPWGDMVHGYDKYNKKGELMEMGPLWGMGTVGIEAVKESSNGKIASYVTKYLSKSYEIKEDGEIERDLEKEKDLADFNNYKELGLHNMKRYSTSKGLKKAINIFIDLQENEYLDILSLLDWLEESKPLSKEGQRLKTYRYENEFRGDIIELIQRKSKQCLNWFVGHLFDLSSLSRPKKKEVFKFLNLKDIEELKIHASSKSMFDELENLEYIKVIGRAS